MENSSLAARVDPRTDRSRKMLVEAAIRLLDERDGSSITVRDVAAAAGVSRPTVYAHFGELSALFQAAGMHRLSEAFGRVTVLSSLDGGAPSVAAALRPLLDDLQAHATFYARVLRGPGGHETQSAVVSFLADRIANVSPLGPFLTRGGADPREAATFLAAGALWLIADWVDSGSTGPGAVDDLTMRLTTLLLSAATGTKETR